MVAKKTTKKKVNKKLLTEKDVNVALTLTEIVIKTKEQLKKEKRNDYLDYFSVFLTLLMIVLFLVSPLVGSIKSNIIIFAIWIVFESSIRLIKKYY